MAQRLGEMLVASGRITRDQLMQALQAQGQLGGRLGTNLVELGFLSEKELALSLSQQLGIPNVSAEHVANIAPDVIRTVPREIAQKYRVVPFFREGKNLHVCMSDPNDLAAIDELGFQLSFALKPFVITEVALNFALERYYDVQRKARAIQLSRAPDMLSGFIQLADTISPLADGGQLERSAFLDIDVVRQTMSNGGTSQDRRDLRTELADARTDDQILSCVGEFLQAAFPRAVLMSIKEGDATVISNVGPGGLRLEATHSVPITEDSLLAEVLTHTRVLFRPQLTDPATSAVCQKYRIEPNDVTLVPIFENRRVVWIALCQGLDGKKLKAMFGELSRFLTRVSCALQILSLRRQILDERP